LKEKRTPSEKLESAKDKPEIS